MNDVREWSFVGSGAVSVEDHLLVVAGQPHPPPRHAIGAHSPEGDALLFHCHVPGSRRFIACVNVPYGFVCKPSRARQAC